MKLDLSFQMMECSQPDCHFRFPAAIDPHMAELDCPMCGGELDTAVSASAAHGVVQQTITPKRQVSALLDNIRSIHNVGSMFRSADGAGINHLYLCGMTASPDHPKLAKAALGAQETVSWSSHRNGLHTAVSLKNEGHQLWAVEAQQGATPLPAATVLAKDKPVVLIVGHEKAGVDPAILAACDRVFALPMGGMKRSLNVAVVFGIAAYLFRYSL